MPMPPSANNLYATIGRKRVKSKGYKAYELAVQTWTLTHHQQVQMARGLANMLLPKRIIHAEMAFYQRRSSILTKDWKPKRNDTANRIKALHDVIAQFSYIDDCWFWSGDYRKTAIAETAETEWVDVTLTLIENDHLE